MPSPTLNDLWLAFLQQNLPAGVVAGTAQLSPGGGLSASVSAYGNVLGNNTSAGVAICTIAAGSLPRGLYRVQVYHYTSAAATPTLIDNVELRKGATSIARILHIQGIQSVAYSYTPKLDLQVDLDGSTALSVNFITNFGAAETQTQSALIVATRIG